MTPGDDPVHLLPHRPPFRFVDVVDELVPGERVRARYRVTGAEAFLAGHFPGNPVFPGVIQLEALAQAGAVALLSDERYAEERVRVLSRKYGPARIRHDLRAKGISGDIVEAISSDGELERARAILGRKYREPATTPEERAKRARFLQGRGFSTEVIMRLMGRDAEPY